VARANSFPSPYRNSPPSSRQRSSRQIIAFLSPPDADTARPWRRQFAQAAESRGRWPSSPSSLSAQLRPAGLVTHAEAVCASTQLGVIFYNRDNASSTRSGWSDSASDGPTWSASRMGTATSSWMTRIYARMGRPPHLHRRTAPPRRLCPALSRDGRHNLLLAIFNFLPQFAQNFYAAVRRRDHDEVFKQLRDFVLPYSIFATGTKAMRSPSSRPGCVLLAARPARCGRHSIRPRQLRDGPLLTRLIEGRA